MNVLVYAISRDDARAPAAGGLREICAAGLRALAETVDEPLAPDLEQLVRYEETVEAVMQNTTILPMRFGSIVDGEDGVRDLLESRAHEFMAALSHLDGAVEYGVQVTALPDVASSSQGPVGSGEPGPGEPGPGESGEPGPGESYMLARLGEQRLRRELQTWLEGALEGVVRESAYRAPPMCASGSLSAAYLVDRESEDEFLIRIAELAEARGHTLSWSGPWPPYSFVAVADQ